jgi:hypothetical protein
MFENGLLKALESEHRAGGAIPEVKAVANGHCHSECRGSTQSRLLTWVAVTEDCKRVQDVWFCFGGGG